MWDAYKFPVTALRPFNTYGRRDNTHFLVERIIVQMLRGDVVKLGDSTPERDLLYIDDHVDAYLTCMATPEASIGQVFNFCTGEKHTVRDLAEKLRDMTGFRGQILWDTIPRRPLDIKVLYGDAAKAKSVLGWQPKVSLEEGLRRTIDFWRKKLAVFERATLRNHHVMDFALVPGRMMLRNPFFKWEPKNGRRSVVAVLIVLVWAICASVMAGIGSLVLEKLCAEWNISDAFWIGLCLAVGLLQLYHFFRPIEILIVVLLCTLGTLGVVLNRNAFVRLIRRVSGAGLWSVFGCVTAILVIAARCAGPVVHYDTGFYGATAVRWFVTYPLVPALINLLGQLGLNSNVFLCEAALEQGPLRGLAFHLLVGLFLCALVVRIVQSYVRVLGGHQNNVVDYFIFPLAVPSIVWILNAIPSEPIQTCRPVLYRSLD